MLKVFSIKKKIHFLINKLKYIFFLNKVNKRIKTFINHFNIFYFKKIHIKKIRIF